MLKPGELARVRRAVRKLPRGSSFTRGSPPPGGAQYLIRYHGRTLTGRQGAVAPEARPAVRQLDRHLQGRGVRTVSRTRATHAP